jgi:hypothetical protein
MKRFVIAIVAVALILVGGVLTFLFLQTIARNPTSQDSVIWLGLALSSCASIAASVHALRNQVRLGHGTVTLWLIVSCLLMSPSIMLLGSFASAPP